MDAHELCHPHAALAEPKQRLVNTHIPLLHTNDILQSFAHTKCLIAAECAFKLLFPAFRYRGLDTHTTKQSNIQQPTGQINGKTTDPVTSTIKKDIKSRNHASEVYIAHVPDGGAGPSSSRCRNRTQ